MDASLSPLQLRVLGLLSGMTPPWRLTGGGALIAAYTRHRTTRDLDLFWCEDSLGDLSGQVESLLRAGGLTVTRSATSPTHVRLVVSGDDERTVVDLVADPVPVLTSPSIVKVGGTEVSVDSPQEILVNKVCALLSRSELRDLEDVIALRAIGVDLVTAIEQAPRKDAGFSPLTLVWVLQNLEVGRLGRLENWTEARIADLETAKQEIIGTILDAVSGEPG